MWVFKQKITIFWRIGLKSTKSSPSKNCLSYINNEIKRSSLSWGSYSASLNQSNCITFYTLLSFCCKLIWLISDSTIRNQYNISFTSLSSCWPRNHTETHTRWSRALTYCSGLVINSLIPYSFIGTSYKYFQSNFV